MIKKLTVSILILGILSFVPATGMHQTTSASEKDTWTYTVRWGDSLWKIANRFSTTVEALRNTNNIWHNTIYAGHSLEIPTSNDSSSQSENSYRRLYVSDYERDLMARAVYSEARGESYTGKVAVASVIINRVLDPEYPNTVEGVIFEPWAFTPVHDGQFWLQPDSTSYSAVEDALRGWDPSYGATVFYNPITATSGWVFTRPIITQIGSHVFAY